MRKFEKIPFAHQAMFAELSACAMDADFDEQLPENGSFVRVASKGCSELLAKLRNVYRLTLHIALEFTDRGLYCIISG